MSLEVSDGKGVETFNDEAVVTFANGSRALLREIPNLIHILKQQIAGLEARDPRSMTALEILELKQIKDALDRAERAPAQ